MSLVPLASATLSRFGIRAPAAGALACHTPLSGEVLTHLIPDAPVTVEAATARAALLYARIRDLGTLPG